MEHAAKVPRLVDGFRIFSCSALARGVNHMCKEVNLIQMVQMQPFASFHQHGI